MKILMIVKYPPIQGGVSVQNFWLAQTFAELGHEVTVLTNANEVEDTYRISLNGEDMSLLNGYRRKGSITVRSTETDSAEVFIPQSRPFVTKLVSMGLDLIEKNKPDVIYAHYLEPYGIAALYLSKLTGIPYVVKHAGSDLGRLGKLDQMRTLHERVYKEATYVITHGRHHNYFLSLGVPESNLKLLGFFPWPPDVFYSKDDQVTGSKLKLLIYGKTGPSKGTKELIEAIASLHGTGFMVTLDCYWGGRSYHHYQDQLEKTSLLKDKVVRVHRYIPHWQLAEEIRGVDAVLFLENQFRIAIHTPGIPFEVMCCGTLLITTKEIADKYPETVNEQTAIVISEKQITPEAIAGAIKNAKIKLCDARTSTTKIHSGELYAKGVRNVELFLADLAQRL